jgi:hypothetical protein
MVFGGAVAPWEGAAEEPVGDAAEERRRESTPLVKVRATERRPQGAGALRALARTFISLPAGHVGVPLGRFTALTIAGCAIWSAGFIAAGALAGGAWHAVATAVGRGSLGLAALVLVASILRRARL